MPQVDLHRTRAAAQAVRSRSQDLLGLGGGGQVRLAAAAPELTDSGTQDVLHDLHSALVVRLFDAATEFGAVADGLDTLADHVEAATGGSS